jgi:uncharacterized protein YfcZ (UPF0381/DUF406 family)
LSFEKIENRTNLTLLCREIRDVIEDLNDKTAEFPEEYRNRARANFILKQFIAPAIRLFAEKCQMAGKPNILVNFK